jgi:hypothetical protein
MTTFMAYGVEKRISRHPEKFGKGAIEGVASPETANNAAAGGAQCQQGHQGEQLFGRREEERQAWKEYLKSWSYAPLAQSAAGHPC